MPELRPPSTLIYGVATFSDDQGRMILARTLVCRDGVDVDIVESMRAVPSFIGQGAMVVQQPNGQQTQVPFQFAIEASSIAEAFLRYESAGQAGMQLEIERQKLAALGRLGGIGRVQ